MTPPVVTWPVPLQTQLRRDVMWKMKLCGCGSPEETWAVVQLLLERSEKRGGGPGSLSFYDPAEDASSRWVEFGAKCLESYDLLEHGGGIGYSWLTETGEILLKFLREFGTDDDKWPSWAIGEET